MSSATPLDDAKAFLSKANQHLDAQFAGLTMSGTSNVAATESVAPTDEFESSVTFDEPAAPQGVQPEGPPKDKDEALEKARQHNFPAPQAYDYEAIASKGQGGWASSATKYEWKDEFGDVPPKDAVLEQELFGNAYMMQQGDNVKALHYEVKVDSSKDILPIQDVSILL
jgi:hypothetical protein